MNVNLACLPLAVGMALLLAGCDGGTPVANSAKPAEEHVDGRPAPRPRPAETAPARTIPAPTAAAAPRPATQVKEEPLAPPLPPVAPEGPAETLPDAPTAPGCTLVQGNPEKTLYVELSAEKKPRRIFLATEVCLRDGPLELLLCAKDTKEHEAVLRMDFGTVTDARGFRRAKSTRLLHTAIETLGVPRGKPVQYLNPVTQKDEFKPPSGITIGVTVHYRKDGKLHTHPAQEWVWDPKGKKPMPYRWVFAGSIDIKDPDDPKAPPAYAADSGHLIAVSNFPDSILDIPVPSSSADADLLYEAKTDRIPPRGSKVWLILEPQPEKK